MKSDSAELNASGAQPGDLGTTVTRTQTVITLDTLVMASLMIVGGKVVQMIGRTRALATGTSALPRKDSPARASPSPFL
jgi:hypothetical protein